MTNKIAVIQRCNSCGKPLKGDFSINKNDSNCESCIMQKSKFLEKEMINKCKTKDMYYKFYVKKEDELKVHKKLKKFKELNRIRLSNLGWYEIDENIFIISNDEIAIIGSVSVMYYLNKKDASFCKICDFTDEGNGNLSLLNKFIDKGLNFLTPFLLMYDGRKSLGIYKK